jgi:7-keto-8-aminopelargonate synthetase-like enzyme
MQGDIAPMPEFVALKERFGARLLVDDAHGTGVNGENGRGTAERLGCEAGVDLHMGTFSKAFATSGGFAAGPHDVVFFVRFMAPTMLFTKSTSAAVAAATLASLRAVRREPERRKRLWENTAYLQKHLKEMGFHLTSQTPITPLHMKGTAAVLAAALLREKFRIWVAAVTFPAVRFGTSILRIIPTANHTRKHLDALLEALAAVKREIPEAVAAAPSKGSKAADEDEE